MQALEVREIGEPDAVLVLAERDTPSPKAGQVLVRVAACATNFPDVLLCRGHYQVRPPLPFVPGIEVSGRIEMTGPGVDDGRLGESVLGPTLLPDGGYAQWALMRAHEAFPTPAALTNIEASALFIAYQTAWLGLHRRVRITPDETVVVHAAAGGVGSAAVQVATAADARVIAVVRGPAKAMAARALGPDVVVVDRLQDDWTELVLSMTAGIGADVIVDPVGGEVFEQSTRCIASEGRILVIGFAGGRIPVIHANHALLKNYSVVGMHLGTYRRLAPEALKACHETLSEMVEAGMVRPAVGATVELAHIPVQLQLLGAGALIGRTVADVS